MKLENASEGVILHFQTMKQLELPMDDRDKMRARDLMNNALHGEVKDTLEDKEICVRNLLNRAGIHKFGFESQLGRLAKKLSYKIILNTLSPTKRSMLTGRCARRTYGMRVNQITCKGH